MEEQQSLSGNRTYVPFKSRKNDPARTAVEWKKYVSALEFHICARTGSNETKWAAFLACAGPEAQQKWHQHKDDEELVPSDDETTAEKENVTDSRIEKSKADNKKTYKFAIKVLNKAFSGANNPMAQLVLFRELKQEENESARDFLEMLEMLAEYCGFTTEEEKTRNIKESFIRNSCSAEFRHALIMKKLMDKPLKEVLQCAQDIEQANLFANIQKKKELQKTEEVFAVQAKVQGDQRKKCSSCDAIGHMPGSVACRAANETCFYCNKVGHFKRCCRQLSGTVRSGKGPSTSSGRYFGSPYQSTFGGQKSIPSRNKSAQEESRNQEVFDLFQKFMKQYKNDSGKNSGKKIKKRKIDKVLAIKDEESQPESSDDDEEYEQVNFVKTDAKFERCSIGNVCVKAIIDSGCRRNLIPTSQFEVMKSQGLQWRESLGEKTVKFKGYRQNDFINVQCRFKAALTFNGKTTCADFFVVDGGEIILLGRDSAIQHDVLKLGPSAEGAEADKKHFNKIKNVSVNIAVNEMVPPVVQHRRRLPLHFEEEVLRQLNELKEKDIIEKVNEPSEWISSLVAIPKKNGKLRLCLDLRDVNKAVIRERHPMPTFDDVCTRIGNAVCFSTMDIEQAFHHLELNEQSRKLTTFYTPWGLFRFKRMPFGISSAPEVFQKTLEGILAGIEGVINYSDDILVFGETWKDHDDNLAKVVNRLNEFNIKLNKGKSQFRKERIEFLGHIFSKEGHEVSGKMLEDIKLFRAPTRRDELSAFLGLASYLGRFIENFAEIASPLRRLANQYPQKSRAQLRWEEIHEKSFQNIKSQIQRNLKLRSFDKSLNYDTYVITDAGPEGLGAILIQRPRNYDKTNRDRIIQFASKTLTGPEKRYSQTEKEALSIVWAVERFQYFLYGTSFVVVTDHRPLVYLYKKHKRTCARIERWVLRLQSFDFEIQFKAGRKNIADPLSRLSAVDEDPKEFEEDAEHYVFWMEEVCLREEVKATTLSEIREEMTTDKFGKELLRCLRSGIWSIDMTVWKKRLHEIETFGDLLLWKDSIYIPERLRKQIIRASHEGHPGRNKTISRLRGRVWWPGMTREAEKEVEKCRSCIQVSSKNRPNPMKMRKLPQRPWQHIAMDFKEDSIHKKKFLVIIDYYSRYIVIKPQKTVGAEETIKSLKEVFVMFGNPETMISDNGPPFHSFDLRKFASLEGIEMRYSTPRDPQSNGLAESAMKGIGKALKISVIEGTNWEEDLLYKYVKMYADSVCESTGMSPFKMMFGREMKRKIPQLQESWEEKDQNIRRREQEKKEKLKKRMDKVRGARESKIKKGDCVLMFDHAAKKLQPNFGNKVFKVISKNKTDYTIEAIEENPPMRYVRNAIHLKKIPSVDDLEQEIQEELNKEPMEEIDNSGNPNNSDETREVAMDIEGTRLAAEEMLGDGGQREQERPKRIRKPNPKYEDFVALFLEEHEEIS